MKKKKNTGNTKGLKPVRLDGRTVIYIEKDKPYDINELRDKYFSKMICR